MSYNYVQMCSKYLSYFCISGFLIRERNEIGLLQNKTFYKKKRVLKTSRFYFLNFIFIFYFYDFTIKTEYFGLFSFAKRYAVKFNSK